MRLYLRYPQGRPKALSFSYDDGVIQDRRLMELLDAHDLKGTFNLNSNLFRPDDPAQLVPLHRNRLTQAEAVALFGPSRHEIAAHGADHPFLEQLPISAAMADVLEDRRRLEALFGGLIRGMAYPFGTYSQDVRDGLRLLGIAYARTTAATGQFRLPADWLQWHPTCHHNDPRLPQLTRDFVETPANWGPQLFLLWGHSYELDDHDNWHVLEDFCAQTARRGDIWYATNLEICDYVTAFGQLRANAAGTLIQNPTAIPLWASRDGAIVCFPPGETVDLAR